MSLSPDSSQASSQASYYQELARCSAASFAEMVCLYEEDIGYSSNPASSMGPATAAATSNFITR